MGKNDQKFEEYLHKLQQLEKDINEGADDDGLINELNGIIDGLTKESQTSIIKNSIKARLKFINRSNNPDPSFEMEGDSGFDLRAFVPFDVQIPVGKFRVIPTGLYFEVEKGLEVQIRPRNGLAKHKGVTVLNTPGTINCKYRGEVEVILANFGEFALTVQNGDKIAQGVVCPVYGEGNLELEKLSDTEINSDESGDTNVK